MSNLSTSVSLTPDEIEQVIRNKINNLRFSKSGKKTNDEILKHFRHWFPGHIYEYRAENEILVVDGKSFDCSNLRNIEICMKIVFEVGFPKQTFWRNACGEWIRKS